MPPDFGCCALATVVAEAAIAATAKQNSLVFISAPSHVSRGRSPAAPALYSWARTLIGCASPGQPGRRAKIRREWQPRGRLAKARALPYHCGTCRRAKHRKRREREIDRRRDRGADFCRSGGSARRSTGPRDDAWKAPLWQALSDTGLTLAWVPEEHGGAGAEIADGFAVLGVAGRYAAAVPLAETLLAGWLLSRAGLKAPKARCRSRRHGRATRSR